MKSVRLQTLRTTLVPMSVVDAPFMLELMTSPLYLRFIGDRGVASIAEVERYIDTYFLKSMRDHGFGYFVSKNNDGESLGAVGFMKKDYLQYPDIGFAFLPEFSGIGLAYEVSLAVLKHGREKWGLSNIDAITSPDNTPSQNLLKRLNFESIGKIQHPDDQEILLLYRLLA